MACVHCRTPPRARSRPASRRRRAMRQTAGSLDGRCGRTLPPTLLFSDYPSFLPSFPPCILIDVVAPGAASEPRGVIQDRFQSRDIEANVQAAKVRRAQVAVQGVGMPHGKLLLALRLSYACIARGLGSAVCHLRWQRLLPKRDQASVCVSVCKVHHAHCKWQPHDVRKNPAIALRTAHIFGEVA